MAGNFGGEGFAKSHNKVLELIFVVLIFVTGIQTNEPHCVSQFGDSALMDSDRPCATTLSANVSTFPI